MEALNKSKTHTINVNTYRFASGQTIDEILKSQTSWATDEQCLLNMIDSDWRAVEDFITDKEKELAKKFQIAANNPETDLKLLAVQSDVATQFLCQKHTNQELWEKTRNDQKGMTRPYSKDVVNIENQINFPYELPSWIKNSIEEIPSNWFEKNPQQLQEKQKKEDIQTSIAIDSITKDIVIEPYSRKQEDIEAMKLFVSNVSGNDIENITNDQAQAFIDNLGTTEEAYLTAKADGTFEYTNNNTYSPDFYKTSEPKEILSIIEDNANHHIIRSAPESEARKNCIKDYEFIHLINEKMNEIEITENKNDKKNALRYHTENILQLNRSIGQLKDNFSGAESQVALNELDNYSEQITKSETPVKADEFLKSIQSIMHVDEEKSKTVRHFTEDNQNNLRISNHSANAVHAKFRPNETSVVIKLSSTKFKTDKDSYLVEYVYDSKNLSKEKQLGIINGLKDWINTGEFTDKQFDKEFYSPTKERYLENKNELKTKQLQALSTRISEMDKELDIWTSKANADDKTIKNLNKQLEQEKAYHTSSCVITVPQRDSNGNEIIGKDGKPLTSTLHCTEGIDAALGKLSRKCVDLTLENKQLREQLNQEKNRNANSQSDDSWSD